MPAKTGAVLCCLPDELLAQAIDRFGTDKSPPVTYDQISMGQGGGIQPHESSGTDSAKICYPKKIQHCAGES